MYLISSKPLKQSAYYPSINFFKMITQVEHQDGKISSMYITTLPRQSTSDVSLQNYNWSCLFFLVKAELSKNFTSGSTIS
jgi:hypothetical protein